MPAPDNNEQLLVAVLAVQLGFARPEQALAAASAWMADRSQTLMDRLQAEGLLSAERRRLLEQVVREALAAHGGDAGKTLTSLGGARAVHNTFAGSVILEPGGKVKLLGAKGPDTPAPGADVGAFAAASERSFAVTPICQNRYELAGEHARGGQARVLVAFDKHVGRKIAWKELLVQEGASCPSGPPLGDSQRANLGRFLREARITGQLEHPNIVPVYEVGQCEDGRLYYTMRLVRGQTLARALQQGKGLRERMRFLSHFSDMCHAIAFAHSRGIIHRDIKPDNVMVGEFGETVMLDWGLAKVRGKEDLLVGEIEAKARRLQREKASATLEGAALGTPAYMSPEQAEGLVEEIDERSDIWGLGAVLYELLTGSPPYTGETPYEIVGKVMKEPVRPVRELCPEAPAELAAIAERALQRQKEHRYQSVREMSEDITAFMTGARVGAYEYSAWELLKRFAAKHRAAFLAGMAVLVAIVASLIFISLSYRREVAARQQESLQRLTANLRLAQAYSLEATRLLRRKMPLSAGIFAAASLIHNPANPRGPYFDPEFAVNNPEALLAKTEADSRLYRSRYRLIDSRSWSWRQGISTFSIAVSPDGKKIASGDHNGCVTLLTASGGDRLMEFKAHAENIWHLAFTPGSDRLVSASADKSIKVWQTNTTEPLLTIGSDAPIYSVAVSPEGALLAGGLGDGSVAVWNLGDAKLLWRQKAHGSLVRDVAFSPDGRRLASASWDRLIFLWEATSGKKLRTFAGHGDAVYSLAFSPDGSQFASAAYDRTVRIWNTDSGSLVHSLQEHDDAVEAVAWSPDGHRIASGSDDGVVRLWDATSGKLLESLKAHADRVTAIAFSPDGRNLFSNGLDNSTASWKLREADGLQRLEHPDWVYGFDFSADGRRVVTGSWDGSVNLWEAGTGKLLWSRREHRGELYRASYSRDGRWIASGSGNGEIIIWESENGTVSHRFYGHRGRVLGVHFSPDSRYLASSSYDKTARLWRVEDGKEVAVLGEHPGWVFDVKFSASGALLATACADKLVRIYRIEEDREKDALRLSLTAELSEHSDWVTGVEFSNDEKYLASCGKDARIVVLQVGDWKRRSVLSGHRQWINQVSFSQDGKLLASAADDEQVIVWDLASEKPILKLRTNGGAFRAAFLPGGEALAVTDHKQIIFYPLDLEIGGGSPEGLLQEAENRAGMVLEAFELKAR